MVGGCPTRTFPAGEPRPLHRAHLDHGAVAEHHAAGVDAEVAGEVLDLGRHGEDVAWELLGIPDPTPGVGRLGEGVLLAGGVAQRLGHVADRRAGPVGDDVGHLGRVTPSVTFVDVLDDLLAPVGLDVDVDVGRAVALRGEEPLEQQTQGHGVGVGDAEGVADRGVGRAPPPLAEDVGASAELDQVPHDEEVPGEAEGLDQGHLVVDLLPRAREARTAPGPVAPLGAGVDHLTQERHLGERPTVGAGRARERRQVRRHQVEVERARLSVLGGAFDRARVAGEAAGLLDPGAQVGGGGRREPAIGLVEAPAGAHSRQGRGQGPLGRGGVVDVVGGHHPDADPVGDAGEGVVAGRVQRIVMIPQLDRHVVGAEDVDQTVQRPLGRSWPVRHQGLVDRSLPAPREHQPLATVGAGEVDAVVDRLPLLGSGQLGGGDDIGETGVAGGAPGQHEQVRPLGIGDAVLGLGQTQGQFGPEHRRQPHRPGRLGEAHHPVETVVIGDGQGFEAQPGRLLGQGLGMRRAVEEAEVRVAVELGVGLGTDLAPQTRRLHVRGPVVRPRRAVAAVAASFLGVSGRLDVARPVVGERPFELGPRDVRVVETHGVRC